MRTTHDKRAELFAVLTDFDVHPAVALELVRAGHPLPDETPAHASGIPARRARRLIDRFVRSSLAERATRDVALDQLSLRLWGCSIDDRLAVSTARPALRLVEDRSHAA